MRPEEAGLGTIKKQQVEGLRKLTLSSGLKINRLSDIIECIRVERNSYGFLGLFWWMKNVQGLEKCLVCYYLFWE